MRNGAKLLATLSMAAMLTGTATATAQAADEPATPVFVTTEGTRFALGGDDFTVVGTNNYYLMYSSPTMVDAVLEKAAAADFNVMRTWAFFDDGGDADSVFANDKGVYFQSWSDAANAPVFNDGANGLEMLDNVIAKAGAEGLKVVLPLTNNWSAFGGMDQYLQWAKEAGEDVDTHDDFYTNEQVKTWYKAWISHLLNRENSITGVVYKDDPTIMTWELANEPRCIGDGGDGTWGTGKFPLDPSCDSSTITPWAAEMSTYIKSIDSNHLVAAGDEGFFDDPTAAEDDVTHNGKDGVDTVGLASLPNIDYMSYHLYPDHWGTDAAWGTQWIADHNAAAATIGKPALLGEFGWRDHPTRNAVYKAWLDEQTATNGAGSLYWILSDVLDDGTTLYADYDGFTVYCPSPVCTTVSNYGALSKNPDAEIPPVADDDPATIDFDDTHVIDVTANDIAYGATIDVATVDLDPATAGRQASVAVSGATASVTDAGVVSVTPASGFSGTITVPYVVKDSAGRDSNIANVVVTVEPSAESWTTIEDFAADADGWSCPDGATVTAQDGVGVFANGTGLWTWCMLTFDTPLDLSGYAKLRYDFVGTDVGANPSIAVKVGDDETWCQIDGLVPNTWTTPSVGNDGPTADFSRFSAACQEQLNSVHQIGFGIQVGTHQIDNIRVAQGYVAPPEGTIDNFSGASTWSCDSGSSFQTEAGAGVFTIDGDWAWCLHDLDSATDISGKSGVSFKVVDTTNPAGLNPSLVLKLGSGWTWCQADGPGSAIVAGDTVTVSFDGLSDDCKALLGEAHTVGLGFQGGTHTLDDVKFVTGGGGDGGDGGSAVVDDFSGDGSGWACDGSSAVSTSGGAGIFAIDGGWAWCLFNLADATDLSGKSGVSFKVVDSTNLAGLNPSLVLKLGSGWTWCQIDGAGSAIAAGDTVTVSFDGLGDDCKAALGEAHAVGLGFQGGTHTIDDVTFVGSVDTSTTVADDFSGDGSAWSCDASGTVATSAGNGVFTIPNGWSWCLLNLAEATDLTGKTAVAFDLVSSDNLANLNPYAVLKLGSGWTWCQIDGSGTAPTAGSTVTFSLTGLSEACTALLAEAHTVGFGFQGGTHTIDNVRFVGADEPTPIAGATPTITGSTVAGSVLTADAGTWTPADVTLAYQWLRDGDPIASATGATYTTGASDVGHAISVTVTGSKTGLDSVSVTSAPTGTITAAVVIVAGTPKVTGSLKVGGTLTAKAGTWTPSGVALTYQWLRDGKSITGAKASAYKTVRADVGHKISVKVTGTKSGLTTVAKTSAAVGPIQFKDVSPSVSGYTAITWLAGHKIVYPYADGTFRPAAALTHRQLAVYLYREAGSPTVKLPSKSPFSDVKKTDYAYTAIVWAKKQGLFTGSTMRPSAAVTRAELAVALYAAAGKPSVSLPAKSPFKDVKRSASTFKAVYWAKKNGIITTYSDGTFRPSAKVTRAKGAQAIYAFAR